MYRLIASENLVQKVKIYIRIKMFHRAIRSIKELLIKQRLREQDLTDKFNEFLTLFLTHQLNLEGLQSDLNKVAEILFKMRYFQLAILYYQKIIEINPKNIEALRGLARSYKDSVI